MKLGNYKIKVTTEAESKEVISLLIQLGYKVDQIDRLGLVCTDNGLIYAESMAHWGSYDGKEIILPQLRDLVVLHRNDVSDANAIDPDHVYSELYLCCDNTLYVFVANTGKWKLSNKSGVPMVLNRLVKTQNNQELDSALISGADAKQAWANGEDVQILCAFDEFCTITTNLSLSIFDDPNNKFRLKPRTITLSIEIPAPFEPKVGDEVFYLDGSCEHGYNSHIYDGFKTENPLWKGEEEIKQVVSALRGALKNG